ncbi:hypothetical protein GGI35DRAFT_124509 [Trichoderma velutinum]
MEISRVPELRLVAPRSGASRSDLLEKRHVWIKIETLGLVQTTHPCLHLCYIVILRSCSIIRPSSGSSTSLLYVCYTLCIVRESSGENKKSQPDRRPTDTRSKGVCFC